MAFPDSNTWYRLTNNYTGPSVFFSTGNITAGSFLVMSSSSSSSSASEWQFFPSGSSNNGNYYLRNSAAGPTLLLGTVFNSNNVPMPILSSADPSSTNQEWLLTVAPGAGGAFGIENVGLGGTVYLDTYSDTLQPFFEAWGHTGQLWTLTSAGNIDDPAYSRIAGPSTTIMQSQAAMTSSTPAVATVTASSTASATTKAPASSSPSSSSSSLSAGAIAGIAVGCAGIFLLAGLVFFFLWRKRQKANVSGSSDAYIPVGMPEAPGDQTFRTKDARKETEEKPAVVELPSSDGGGHGYVSNSGQHVSELSA